MIRFLLVVLLSLGSIAANAQTAEDEKYQPIASALTKLARAVYVYVATTQIPSNLTDEERFRAATKHDPKLLAPFGDYKLSMKIEGKNSSVLVCSLDGAEGLIEDAGCTARSDLQLWNRSPPAPCTSSLDIAQLCSPRKGGYRQGKEAVR